MAIQTVDITASFGVCLTGMGCVVCTYAPLYLDQIERYHLSDLT